MDQYDANIFTENVSKALNSHVNSRSFRERKEKFNDMIQKSLW